jgi:hypothetical protein
MSVTSPPPQAQAAFGGFPGAGGYPQQQQQPQQQAPQVPTARLFRVPDPHARRPSADRSASHPRAPRRASRRPAPRAATRPLVPPAAILPLATLAPTASMERFVAVPRVPSFALISRCVAAGNAAAATATASTGLPGWLSGEQGRRWRFIVLTHRSSPRRLRTATLSSRSAATAPPALPCPHSHCQSRQAPGYPYGAPPQQFGYPGQGMVPGMQQGGMPGMPGMAPQQQQPQQQQWVLLRPADRLCRAA